MIYEYLCGGCEYRFDVVKTVAERDQSEVCAKCGATALRNFVPTRLHLVGTKVEEAEYNPGLGCIVKNKKHRAEIAKQKGLVEVGNTSAETLHKMHDQARLERREKAWNEATKGWVGAE